MEFYLWDQSICDFFFFQHSLSEITQIVEASIWPNYSISPTQISLQIRGFPVQNTTLWGPFNQKKIWMNSHLEPTAWYWKTSLHRKHLIRGVFNGNLRAPPPMPTPLRNKAWLCTWLLSIIIPYNNPQIRPYFLGGALGFPWFLVVTLSVFGKHGHVLWVQGGPRGDPYENLYFANGRK